MSTFVSHKKQGLNVDVSKPKYLTECNIPNTQKIQKKKPYGCRLP